MANSKKEKVNNPNVISKDAFAIFFIILAIGVYVFIECYSAIHVDVETVTAVTSTVYESIDAKALVIRDEHIVNDSGGVTVACAQDGEKVKLKGNIAKTFSSEESAKNYSLLQDLHSELEYYVDLESKSNGLSTDIETIDRDILSDVNDYIRARNNTSVDKLSNYGDELNDKLARRQMIIGQAIDFSAVKGELQSQINAIDPNSCVPTGAIMADESGIFSSYTDGFESSFNYDKIEELNVNTLNSYIKQVEESENEKKSFGKLVTSYEWYFCCVVDSDAIKDIHNGDKLDVALKDSDQIISCKVVSGADTDLGTKETVLILSSSKMNGEITSMRLEDIEIRYNSYTGFKVPASAIHVDEDGKKCVYALVANQVSKRSGDIIYSTKDFVVFSNDSSNSESIRYYDQIITKGKDLHDGKVYT